MFPIPEQLRIEAFLVQQFACLTGEIQPVELRVQVFSDAVQICGERVDRLEKGIDRSKLSSVRHQTISFDPWLGATGVRKRQRRT